MQVKKIQMKLNVDKPDVGSLGGVTSLDHVRSNSLELCPKIAIG